MNTRHVLSEDRERIRVLTLNRPDVLNAVNQHLCDELTDELLDAKASNDVSVVVLTGAGRAFCAGTDLDELAATGDFRRGPTSRHGFDGLLDSVTTLTKPLLLAVNGLAVGIGATLLPHADLVIMAETARIRFPFTALGLVPEAAASATLPLQLGRQTASWLLLSSEWIEATTCQRLGLAWELCPADEVLTATIARAELLAALPLEALTATKELISESVSNVIANARQREDRAFDTLLGGEALRAALSAFTHTKRET